MKNPFIIPAIILFLFTGCNKINPKPGDEALSQYLEKKMHASEIIGMQAAYMKNGELAWNKSYGIKNIETNEAVNDKTLFMIASSSKPVTATALMRLADLGLIDLDADINNYLPFKIRNPNFPNETISARMLLTHTSSLKDDWDTLDPLYTLEDGGDSPIELKDFVPGYFLENGTYYNRETNFHVKKPGSYWDYCNMGYVIIGFLIQEITEKPFETYMAEDFFPLLGMNDSYWFLRDIPHDNIAKPHEISKKSETKMYPHYGYPDFPDGQLRTTVVDYAKFLEIFLNEGIANGQQFLKQETVKDFLKVQFPAVHKHQAISWNYDEMESFIYYRFMPRLASHTGGDPGVATVISFDPSTKTAAIVFTNSPPYSTLKAKNLYLDMVKRLLRAAL
ncbi:serine hydrolase domain-containing protein [uncultured Arcticibacterium sp.]|uniref:serine hydrolase domain-containing protein n=1 Tax=uncultured Arcticibacterium sp. TaxID=2173042 RepID=UPI0030F523BC